MSNGQAQPPVSTPRASVKVRPLIGGIVAGVGLALLVLLVLLFVFARGSLPLVTDAALATATQRWERHGPKSYRLRIVVHGERNGAIDVEVRDGEPVHLTRDGRTPARHTWDFWTVPGQLDAIQSEMTGDPQAMFGVPDHSQVIQRGQFDPELGYPRKYERYVLGKDFQMGWEVVQFEALSK
jgi:hypothetical protein